MLVKRVALALRGARPAATIRAEPKGRRGVVLERAGAR
jgi:hypothetical protein